MSKLKRMLASTEKKAAKKADKQRKALHPGKRVSDSGKVYYENRSNRSDKNRTIKLAKGGKAASLKKGDKVTVSDYALKGRVGVLVSDKIKDNYGLSIYKVRFDDLNGKIIEVHEKEVKKFSQGGQAEDVIEALADKYNKMNLSNKRVEEVLKEANEELGGYGVEGIDEPGWYVDTFWGDTQASYVNMGDTYEKTLIYDTNKKEFVATDWGTFYEENVSPKKNVFIVDSYEERGNWTIDVKDANSDNSVWDYSFEGEEGEDGEASIIEDGFMKHMDDLDGLRKYLISMKVVDEESVFMTQEEWDKKFFSKGGQPLGSSLLEDGGLINGWEKQKEWHGNPSLGLESYKKMYSLPSGRKVPVYIWGNKEEGWNYTVSAGNNSDYSHTGTFDKEVRNLSIEDVIKAIDKKRIIYSEGGKLSDNRIDTVAKHYMIAALWSSSDDNDDPLDSNYDISDIDADTAKKMKEDVKLFLEENKEALEESGLSDDQIGHDFWLTRNGHGAGFFDRMLDIEVENKLMNSAQEFTEVDLYVGDDNKVHASGSQGERKSFEDGGKPIGSTLLANGGAIERSKKIYLEYLLKVTNEDSFENGQDDSTTQFVLDESIKKTFDTPKEMFEWLEKNYGISADPSKYSAFEDSRLEYSHLEDADGYAITEKDRLYKLWKEGTTKLWSASYSVYVKYITVEEITTADLVDYFQVAKYESGGKPIGSTMLSKGGTLQMAKPLGSSMLAKGGMAKVERIANAESSAYSENLIPFKGNNLEGKVLENGDYVVLSYGYYPIWFFSKKESKWYGNKDKYSMTTAKQLSQSRPTHEATLLSHQELLEVMKSEEAKYDLGGLMIQNLYPQSYNQPVVDNTAIAHGGGANTQM